MKGAQPGAADSSLPVATQVRTNSWFDSSVVSRVCVFKLVFMLCFDFCFDFPEWLYFYLFFISFSVSFSLEHSVIYLWQMAEARFKVRIEIAI